MRTDERIIFRTVFQCAPLVTEGYTENISTSGENYTAYYYGPDTSGHNYTYKTSTLDAQYHQTNGNEFILRALLAPTLNGNTSRNAAFTPTPGLFPTDGDLMLTFLVGNGVHFMERAQDPWYRGTVPGKNVTWNGANGKLSKLSYTTEQAASPMACLRQFQFCNPALPEDRRCGPLASALDAQVQAAHLFNMTEDQIANSDIPDTPSGSRYVWFLEFLATIGYGPDILVNYLGPNSLASQSSLSRYPGLLGAIPSNQWQLDVENWWAIHMATLQAGMVAIAYGNHDPALKPFEIPPFNAHYQKLCNNQKIVSTDYTSFSVFGICFIYVTGALIIAISYLLEQIQAWLYRRRKVNEYAYLEWTANETLQLQRMAYQGVGSGNWSRYTDRIPLTETGDILADLPRSYPLDKKEGADVEQGNLVEQRTGTTVTTVQTAPLRQVETDGSSATPCDENSQVDQTGVGGRQSVEVVSPGHIPQDDSIHSPVLPHMDANPRPPADAAPMKVEELEPQVSKDPVKTTPVL
ncbi:hypothetical protein INS49_001157 [Diaporthe citri]|uniref:uncharacterized protein n=1 Tax=Diaporthe citri TaxID=83186 RepID=UPI001C7FF54E|nr:uncharacterized protein INS49_001157 [Diaporthe citri]KAG6366976.1 hypothetical protein INS49_001157 [Diaporthe citri]